MLLVCILSDNLHQFSIQILMKNIQLASLSFATDHIEFLCQLFDRRVVDLVKPAISFLSNNIINNRFLSMSRSSQRSWDLPLVINLNRANPCLDSKNKNMPMQLKNDLYRVSSKENIPQYPSIKNTEESSTHKKKTITNEKKQNHGSNKKDSNRLKQIIKRKLNYNEQNVTELQEAQTTAKDKRNVENRYHQLLREFYGQPTKERSVKRPNLEENKSRYPQLKRHQSAKSLKPIEVNEPRLTRMRSHSSIKPTQFYSKAPSQSSKKPSYLDLYMQKRKAILFL